MYVIIDYHSSPDCDLLYGINSYGGNPSDHVWKFTSSSYGSATVIPTTPGTSWGHFESEYTGVEYNRPYNFMFEDFSTTISASGNCKLDNIIISSTHGPLEYNIGAHKYIYPTFMILSHDYDGFNGSNNL